jgi:phosphoribosyl 1,2-cyclic phosphate phosphodiesterase
MSDLKLTFLGTGTSMGVPMIGCDCEVCSSGDPRDKRTRASLYIETPEASWVVDTGPDFRTQALRERLRTVDAVVYTHSHTDHIMGLDDLRPFCFGSRDLPIHASAETMADLERVYVFAFNGKNRWPGYLRPAPKLIDTTITPLPLEHGRTQMFGFLFSRNDEPLVAYLTDCKVAPPATIERIRGVRHLIVDALRHTPHPTHMNIEEALALRAQVGPKRTWFTHLCHDLGHAATEATLPETVRIAYDGLNIEA